MREREVADRGNDRMKSLDRVRLTYSARGKAKPKEKVKTIEKETGKERQVAKKVETEKKREARERERKEKAVWTKSEVKVEGNGKEIEDLRRELEELSEELGKAHAELSELRKGQNDSLCQAWLQGASGRSTVLACVDIDEKTDCSSKSRANDSRRDATAQVSTVKSVDSQSKSNEDLQVEVREKDRIISSVRAQLAAVRLKREESLKSAVQAEVSRRSRELEAKYALDLSQQEQRVEEKSKATVGKLMKKMESFVASKIRQRLEDLVSCHEEKIGLEFEAKNGQLNSLAKKQEALRSSLQVQAKRLSEELSTARIHCLSLEEAKSKLDRTLKDERDRSTLLLHEKQSKQEIDVKKWQSELEQMKAQASASASQYMESNKSLCRKLAIAEEALVAKERDIQQLQGKISDASTSNTNLHAREREAREEISLLKKCGKELTVRAADVKQALDNAVIRNNVLEGEVHNFEVRLQGEKDAASNYAAEARLEIERQNDKVLELEGEISELQRSLECRKVISDEYRSVKISYDSSASENVTLSSQLEDLKLNFAESQEALNSERKQHEDCKAKLSDAKRMAELLKIQSDTALKTSEACTQENRNLKAGMCTIKEMNKQKLKQTTARLQECKKQLDSVQQEKHDVEERHFKVRSELHEIKTKLRGTENALKTSSDRYKKLAADHQKITKEYDEMESKFRNTECEKEKKKQSSLEQLVALQSELISTTKSVITMKTEGEKKDEHIRSLLKEQEQKRKEIASLSNEVDTLKREKTDMRSKIAVMRSKPPLRQETNDTASSLGSTNQSRTPSHGTTDFLMLKENTNCQSQKGSSPNSRDKARDREDFDRIVSRIKRINKKFKLKLGSVIKHTELSNDEGCKKAALPQLIYSALTALDRAREPITSSDYLITLMNAGGEGEESERESPVFPNTMEAYFQNKYKSEKASAGKILILK